MSSGEMKNIIGGYSYYEPDSSPSPYCPEGQRLFSCSITMWGNSAGSGSACAKNSTEASVMAHMNLGAGALDAGDHEGAYDIWANSSASC
jgi:hypothetical protein